jgi:hypothetical protein
MVVLISNKWYSKILKNKRAVKNINKISQKLKII